MLEEVRAAFPQLEVEALIGQGGMGFVYKAYQPSLDRTVALKLLSPELSRDPAFAERFAREARVLGKLNHPNVVKVYEHGQSGGFFYLLMEYVDGVNLRQAMRAGRFTPQQALGVVPGICDALQAAHAQGVWHRDIKPENILLDTQGGVKIVDFGIARLVGDPRRDFTLTMTGAALGSAAYMAPEQHEKPHDVDHRADIYSLGVVLYEMLTGELPLGRFKAPSTKSDVDARIDEIVMRTLEKERELRQQSAQEVKTEVMGAPAGHSAGGSVGASGRRAWETVSERNVWGLPLYHIVTGADPATGKFPPARGFFAVGRVARGVFALGGRASGLVAVGGMASGVVAIGGVSVGLLAAGGGAVAAFCAAGGLAIAPLALGGTAVGVSAIGGNALALEAWGAHVMNRNCRPLGAYHAHLLQWLEVIIIILSVLITGLLQSSLFARSEGPSKVPPAGPDKGSASSTRKTDHRSARLTQWSMGLMLAGLLLSIASVVFTHGSTQGLLLTFGVVGYALGFIGGCKALSQMRRGMIPVEGRSGLRVLVWLPLLAVLAVVMATFVWSIDGGTSSALQQRDMARRIQAEEMHKARQIAEQQSAGKLQPGTEPTRSSEQPAISLENTLQEMQKLVGSGDTGGLAQFIAAGARFGKDGSPEEHAAAIAPRIAGKVLRSRSGQVGLADPLRRPHRSITAEMERAGGEREWIMAIFRAEDGRWKLKSLGSPIYEAKCRFELRPPPPAKPAEVLLKFLSKSQFEEVDGQDGLFEYSLQSNGAESALLFLNERMSALHVRIEAAGLGHYFKIVTPAVQPVAPFGFE